jgi:transposase
MRIIRAIVNGERDPDVLASYRDRGCHASVETIRQALIGNDREEHIFALSQALELYDTYQAKVAECDKRIAAVLKRLKEASPTPADPLPAARHKGRSSNPLTFDVREALHAVIGIDLTQIHGLGPYLALKLVGECGTDLSAWPALHLLAWPGAAQQDLRGEGSVLANAPFRQPGGVAVAAGGGDGRPHRHGAGRLLPPVVRARRQGQGRHRHGPQDRGALL